MTLFRIVALRNVLSFANNRSGQKLLCCSTFISVMEAAEGDTSSTMLDCIAVDHTPLCVQYTNFVAFCCRVHTYKQFKLS